MSRPGGAARSDKAAATRKRVLDAAAKVFRDKGYMSARLSDIAATAGTQAGSLYYHFDSRGDLVREVLSVAQHQTTSFVRQRVEQVGNSATSLERLREGFNAHLEVVLKSTDYTAATLRILGQVPPDIRREAIEAQREYGFYWRELFWRAQGDGFLREDLNLTVASMFVLGSLNGTSGWFQPSRRAGRLDLPQLRSQALSVFMEGIATQKGRSRQPIDMQRIVDAKVKSKPIARTKAEETSLLILAGAARIFREHGYAKTRLADIASMAELHTSSLYYHFSSREDLVVALVRHSLARVQGDVESAIKASPSGAGEIDLLSTTMAAHLSSLLSGEDYGGAMLKIVRQVPESVGIAIVPLQRQYLELWQNLLRGAVDAGQVRGDLNLDAMLMLMMGALSSSIDWYEPNRLMSLGGLIDQSQRILFDGILAASSSERKKRPEV